MTLLYAAALGVLIVAGFHIVYGWVFSNGFRREVLTVRPRPKELSIRVGALSGDQIELRSPEPRQDIGHPGIFGLVWDSGNARVGDVVAASDTGIVRQFFPGNDGPPPVCHGPLESCPPVELDPYVYRSDPSDAGLRYSETRYSSPLGEMGAWLVPGDGDVWAVHCHGWTAERRELIRLLPTFHEVGMTSLVIDYRNDPGNPGDPTGLHRFGLTEWEDLEAAVGHALQSGADEVVLTGCSTGGALVMAFLERSLLASKVKGVVLDSPNINLVETVRLGVRHVRSTPLMKEFGLWITHLRWKVDWEATNYASRADETLRVPTLVYHGTSDRVVPISTSRILEARAPELVRLIEVPAAGHVMSWNADPTAYQTALSGFLRAL